MCGWGGFQVLFAVGTTFPETIKLPTPTYVCFLASSQVQLCFLAANQSATQTDYRPSRDVTTASPNGAKNRRKGRLKNISPADIMSRAGAKRKTRHSFIESLPSPARLPSLSRSLLLVFLRRQLFCLLTSYLGTDMTDNKSCFSFYFLGGSRRRPCSLFFRESRVVILSRLNPAWWRKAGFF